jgi:hypothetical protein
VSHLTNPGESPSLATVELSEPRSDQQSRQHELIQAPTPSAAACSRPLGSVAGPVAGHEVSPILVVIVGSSVVSHRSHRRRRTSRIRPDGLDAYVPWTCGIDEPADEAVIFAVCAPTQHASSWRRYAELRTAFPDTGQRTIRVLTAETVASHHPDAGAAITNLYPVQELLWPTAH